MILAGTSQDSSIKTLEFRQGFASYVTIAVKDWTLTLSTRSLGTPLGAGRYVGAIRAPFTQPNEPGLEMTAGSWGCNTITGEFTVVSVHFAVDGSVDEITANYEHHCESGQGFNYGCVHVKVP